jgi:hypothetical protein
MSCVDLRPRELAAAAAAGAGAAAADMAALCPPSPASTAAAQRPVRQGWRWWRWLATWAVFFPGGGLAYRLLMEAANDPGAGSPDMGVGNSSVGSPKELGDDW